MGRFSIALEVLLSVYKLSYKSLTERQNVPFNGKNIGTSNKQKHIRVLNEQCNKTHFMGKINIITQAHLHRGSENTQTTMYT